MRASMASKLDGGVARGMGFSYSGGRLRHEVNRPVRSMCGPGNSTETPMGAPTDCSWP